MSYETESPVVQRSSIQAFGACDPGSNPGRAIFNACIFLFFLLSSAFQELTYFCMLF